MKTHLSRTWSKTILLVLIPAIFAIGPVFLSDNSGAYFECCTPPAYAAAAARFPKGATVTVYIPPNSGLTPAEVTAFRAGMEDWNDEANNSQVDFTVVEAQPPAAGTNNTVIVNFQDRPTTANGGAEIQMHQSGSNIYAELNLWSNHRQSGTAEFQLMMLRVTSRHEGGHGIGLDNALNCAPGSTIMNPSWTAETFISSCDNNKINQDPYYAPTPSPTPTPEPDPCASQVQGSGLVIANALCSEDGGDLSESGSGECNDGIDNDQDGLIDCDESSCSHYGCVGGCSTYQQELCIAIGTMGCWQGMCYTPILIDVNGDGYKMTNASNGVSFRVLPNFRLMKLSWTAENSDDAWLVLDRNGNGTIDSGEEQFGNATPQPWSVEKNGFKALAIYDSLFYGGHEDGVIDGRDAIFAQLQLWCDRNHNGISEPDELSDLTSAGLSGIELNYKEWKKVDEFGNAFRYRAKVLDGGGHPLGKWAFDVFVKTH